MSPPKDDDCTGGAEKKTPAVQGGPRDEKNARLVALASREVQVALGKKKTGAVQGGPRKMTPAVQGGPRDNVAHRNVSRDRREDGTTTLR